MEYVYLITDTMHQAFGICELGYSTFNPLENPNKYICTHIKQGKFILIIETKDGYELEKILKHKFKKYNIMGTECPDLYNLKILDETKR